MPKDEVLLWLSVASDLAIGASYLAISILISIAIVRHRIGVILGQFAFWVLAMFLSLGGINHFFDVAAIFKEWYWPHGILSAVTAVVSIIGALVFENRVRTVAGRARLLDADDSRRYRLHLLIENQNLSQLARLHQIIEDVDKAS